MFGHLRCLNYVSVNQELQEQKPGWNKDVPNWVLLRLQPREHSFKKHLNWVPPDYQMGEAYKGKKLHGYINCLSELWLVGIPWWSSC